MNETNNILSDAMAELIEIIYANKFNHGDKIIVNSDTLFAKTGWKERGEFDRLFNDLFSIEIKMLDEGEETDSFFLHN
jgi:hypothetical protein